MFTAFLLSLAIQALLTLAILRWLARDEADLDYGKLLMVTAGLALLNGVLSYALRPHIGLWYLIITLVITAWALHEFCWVAWPRALLCSMVLGAVNLALVFGAVFAMAWFTRSNEPTAMERHDQELAEAVVMLKEDCESLPVPFEGAPDQPTPVKEPPPTEKMSTVLTAATAVATVPATAVASADWSGAQRQLKMGGVVRSGQNSLVLINGSIHTAGHDDTVSVGYHGSNYTWQVTWQSNQVVLLPLQVVPLAAAPGRKNRN